MASLSLTFHETTFNIVECDQQAWITSRELGQALGYARDDAVNKIYERNLDEFSYQMTRNVKMTLQGQQREVRVFSLRGCHLIAMFAKTTVAKEFRKWVLDILDRDVQPKTKNHKTERVVLNDAVNMLVAKSQHLNFSEAYKLIHQRFSVKGIDEISLDQIPVAVEYVHHLIALFSHREHRTADMNTIALAHCMIWCCQWWKEYGDAIRKINPNIASSVHDYFIDGSFVAWGYVDESEKAALRRKLDAHQWNLTINERLKLL
ncbi:Bro-N domain-containing protein [Acinetobacter suaedae]|uniref:Bro-N domain-containing protein n=1 Tax=Acinetobacter suaedae TaxID=2609668 RepID=A0A5P1USW7_9GAMM|nr:Bro-N domain-containing protein [Acinetobacter sp. C16S1]QER39252.1 Bro-N domain-containing protein [Acinetobacter sp. C16S1]